MPSPFPGMDPYLEGDLWQDVHERLANQISLDLMPRLAPRYVALLAKRYAVDGSIPQVSVEIRDVAQRRLVTVIEILSPANKIGDGGREYNDWRLDLLQTQVHLLEIDLLRGGARIALNSPSPPAAYYVYLSRVDRRPFTLVWAVRLQDRLPTVPVPLLPPDPDAPLNLQAALDTCYNIVGYDRLLDYSALPPAPEMSADDRAWVEAPLLERGLRQP